MNTNHFLGIDIGSSYTKITVIDNDAEIVHQSILTTLTRNKNELKTALETIYSNYDIVNICATGYGRSHFKDAKTTHTEISCAALAVSKLYPVNMTIIDIGGEDIKVIKCGDNGKVDDFFLNTKCSAGTGTFINEIAGRAEIDVSEMSELASKSGSSRELNSFCTVFAKTEIMSWIFDDVPIEDIAKGIYISIANRISKLRMDMELPIYLVGGVIAYHPFLKKVLDEKFNKKTEIADKPQFICSLGAALIAKRNIKQMKPA